MPDLKSELLKLNNLKFDDAEDEPTQAVFVDKATSMRERVWNYVKANPASSAADVSIGLGIGAGLAASQLFALHERGLVAKAPIDGLYHYQALGDSYPRFDRKAHGKKLGKAAKGKPRANKANDAQVKLLTTAVQQNATATDILNTMSVMQARAVYDELKRIFGG